MVDSLTWGIHSKAGDMELDKNEFLPTADELHPSTSKCACREMNFSLRFDLM